MNTIPFVSVQHFRDETKKQTEFFNNLSLNQYRKAIANRYGYKSILKFEEQIKIKEIRSVFISIGHHLLDSQYFLSLSKNTLGIEIKNIKDVEKAINYVFDNACHLKFEELYKNSSEVDFLHSTFQGQQDLYQEAYSFLNDLDHSKKYIVSWLFVMITELEVRSVANNCAVVNTFCEHGYKIEQLLPTEQKNFQFNEACFLQNKNGKEVSVSLTELITDILN
jgi:hypothetical protein